MLVTSLLLVFGTAFTPRVFDTGFRPIQRYAPISQERAREGSAPMAALSGRLAEVRRLVKATVPMMPGPGSVCVAISLPEGWLYVSDTGYAFGSHRGGFDVMGWERLKKRFLPGLPSSPLVRIDFSNATPRTLDLTDGAGYSRALLPPRTRRKVTSWFGPHRVREKGDYHNLLWIDRLFSEGKAQPEGGMSVTFGHVGSTASGGASVRIAISQVPSSRLR